MKEIAEIINTVFTFGSDDRAVLATVIEVKGSGYRLPGARMLILADGRTVGTVSGGCLEADVLERAKKVMASGEAEVFTYDTTGDETSVFSMNMGCRGVIKILLETVHKSSLIIGTLQARLDMRFPQKIATLIEADSEIDVNIGGRVIYSDPEQYYFEGLPNFLENLNVLTIVESLPDSGYMPETKTFRLPEGNFTFAFEVLKPPIAVKLFGAGADAVPFVRIASELGWQVTVHDHRPAFLTPERFPAAHMLVHQLADDALTDLETDGRTAVVIMTHNYARDRFILPAVMNSEAFYIGALGPKRRTEQLIEEIGGNFSPELLARLYAPAGLDIGADTPEGIALSIIGEIQSVLKNRDGGHLRDRQGSIYGRS